MSPANQQQYAVSVFNLTKRFGNVVAVNDLTFAVPKGVICGFVGPNGSGKTTTMRILATLLRPDAGIALVFDRNVANDASARAVRHSIGFMPDYFGLYRDMTAGEYLQFFAAAYSIPLADREALTRDILDIVGLPAKHDTLVSGLSRGMQQRLSLGRCLVHSPDLLLLDEPASGLDPRARIELMELLRELQRMGKTILISSHILSELGSLCDTVVIIENGCLVYNGSLEDAANHVHAGKAFMELTLVGNHGTPEEAAALVEALDGVVEVRRQGLRLYVEHASTLPSADIVDAVIHGGLRLAEARRGEARLEEIFMSLTKGE